MRARRHWRKQLRDARRVAVLRAQERRAAVAGISVGHYRAALSVACRVWSARRPWCWLPERVRGLAWEWLGRGFAGRFVREWAANG